LHPLPEIERAAVVRSLRIARRRATREAVRRGEDLGVPVQRRSYGSGSLLVRQDKRGRQTWYGTWWSGRRRIKRRLGLRRPPGGSQGLTRSQAEKELRRLMQEDLVVVGPGDRRTIAEAGAAYVDHLEHVMERKRSTLEDYRGYLRRHLEPFFGDQALARVDASLIAVYLKRKRAEGLSSKTVQNHLNFLHGLFKFALKRGWTESNPVALVDRPRTRPASRRIRFLQPDELDAVIRAVPDDELGPTERALSLCAAMAGLRQGELLGLRWLDVDWTASRIRVADSYTRGRFDSPKSHAGRSVPMADRLAGELDRHFTRSAYQGEDDLAFCHPRTGRVLDPSRLRKRFRRALDRADVRQITFHELRHTFGTQMAAAGAPLRAIQEWMGHADAKTTEIYAHYAPDPSHGAAFAERAFGQPAGEASSVVAV
jgi:integrase